MPAFDPAKRRKATRRKGYKGIDLHVPGEVLADAGWPLDGPLPYYKVAGYQRSKNGRTITVSLYTDP